MNQTRCLIPSNHGSRHLTIFFIFLLRLAANLIVGIFSYFWPITPIWLYRVNAETCTRKKKNDSPEKNERREELCRFLFDRGFPRFSVSSVLPSPCNLKVYTAFTYLWFIAVRHEITCTPSIRADPREYASRILSSDSAHHLADLLIRSKYDGT